jgi:hypothetical protein
MTPKQAEDFLRALGSTKFNKSALPWLHGQCPLARWRHEEPVQAIPKFGILTGNVRPRCHCFACGFGGGLDTLIGTIMLLSNNKHGYDLRAADAVMDQTNELTLDLEEEEDTGPKPLMPYPEAWWETFPRAINCKPAVEYLAKRGLESLQEIELHDLRYDPTMKRVVFPVRGRDGLLYGARGRLIEPGEPRYFIYKLADVYNSQMWYGEHGLSFDDPILVVESVFDRIAAYRFYKNVIAPLSASVSDTQIKRVMDGFSFVYLFDADKAGTRAGRKMQKELPKAHHTFLRLPKGHDPSSIPKQQLGEIISEVLPTGS